MGNRVFNINGPIDKIGMLTLAIELAFMQWHDRNPVARAWSFDQDKGLILHWSDSEGTKLPIPLPASSVVPWVVEWLKGDEAKSMEPNLKGFDVDADHDGSNGGGWRVYVEDWGHVGKYRAVLCAITPAYMWYGK